MPKAVSNIIDFTAYRNAKRPAPVYQKGDFAKAYAAYAAAPITPAPRSDAMAILQSLASTASVMAADPQAVAHPDHELLGLCDQIVMLRNQEDDLTNEWREMRHDAPEEQATYNKMKALAALVRRPLLRAGKLPAATAAGIFAKALAVRRTGLTGVRLGKSLANDLLASPELRAVLWPTGARSD